MPTRNEKIEFIRDVLRQSRVRECIGKVCEECKFYDSPNCLETCYATELVDMGVIQIPVEKQNSPEADSPIVVVLKEIPGDNLADTVKVVTSSVDTYVNQRLETFVNTIKKHAQSFLMRDTSTGQYRDEQYVPVVTIDHVFSLFSNPEKEYEVKMSDYYTERPNEAKLQEILSNGCDWEQLAQDLLSWLSDDEVGEFARTYEWFQEVPYDY